MRLKPDLKDFWRLDKQILNLNKWVKHSMSMKKVFVNGYGSIGSRITSFLQDDSEISVIGVGKYSPDEKVNVANSRGLNVYVPENKLDKFSNYKIAGTIESALDECDLVIDASPGGHGYKNKIKSL